MIRMVLLHRVVMVSKSCLASLRVKTLSLLQVLRVTLDRVMVSRKQLFVSSCRPVVDLVARPILTASPRVVTVALNVPHMLFVVVVFSCSCDVV